MTIEEFQLKVKELIEELNKNKDEEYSVFVLVSNDTDIYHYGYGCPACAADIILGLVEEGAIEHNRKEEIH